MDGYEFLCPTDRLHEGEFCEQQLVINDIVTYLVATRHQGQPRVWLNVCPHQGRPLNWAPDQFITDDQGHLVCAVHGAVFEPDQGLCIAGPCRNAALKTIEALESNQKVYVKTP